MEDLTGRQFGPYRIVAPLGEGGMAVVYKAYQPNVDRYVALKILPAYFARDPQFVGRFQQEAKLLANLQHVNILPVHDFGESDGYTYIVMPFIETGTLGELLSERPLPLPTIQRIIAQVGSALDYAHSRGIVHRDIKPNNILINEQGDCLLSDFGIAKIVEGTSTFTQMGGTLGTPTYMSPEQIRGEKLDGRSDIYSLGVVLYEMATGRPPFRAETPPALFVKHLHDPLPPPHLFNPDLPAGVERVILKALAKDRDDRYATAGELAAALVNAIATQPTAKQSVVPETEAAPPPAPPIPARRTPVPETEPAIPIPPKRTPVPETEPAVPTPPKPIVATELTSAPTTRRRFPAWAIGLIALVAFGGLAAGAVAISRPGTDRPALTPTGQTAEPTDTMPVVAEVAPSATPQPVAQAPSPTDTPTLEALAGRTIRVAGRWDGPEGESMGAVNERFSELTGIRVFYDFRSRFDESAWFEMVESEAVPDVAFIFQPHLARALVEANRLVPLWPAVVDRMRENLAPAWVELGSTDGVPYGVMYRVELKSLVWYPKEAFEAAGYEVPHTWEELIALSDQIVADGGTPWCIGMEAGDATGWVATDWIEDLLLRTAGPEAYDLWVSHRIPFNSDPIWAAAEPMAQIWFNPAYVRGGTNSVLTSSFGEASLPMWEEPPGCYLHRQGNFIVDFWPEEIRSHLDESAGVFALPAINDRWDRPLLVEGYQAVAFDDRPEVRAYLEYLADGAAVESWARAGGALFPHRNQDLNWYPTAVEQSLATLVINAEIARHDASDQMPAGVGGGAFWAGMVEWVRGAPLETVLSGIDASWPRGPAGGEGAVSCEDPFGCVHLGPGEPILIGAMLALSSPDGGIDEWVGLDALRGLEMAVEERGEVLEHPLELALQDSRCTEEGSEQAAVALAADRQIVAIVGPSCSSEARAAVPIACDAHVALISPSATAPELTAADRPDELGCFLRTAPNDSAQGVAAAEYARETLGVTRAATIGDGSTYAAMIAQAFEDRFRQLGGEITAQEVAAPDGSGAGPALARVAGSRPELIFYPVFAEAGGQLTRLARSTPGLEEVHLMGAGGMFSPEVLELAGEAAVGLAWSTLDLSAVGPGYERLLLQYEKRYGELPVTPFHAYAYDAAQLILQAIEKTAVRGENGALQIGRQALLEALYAARHYEGLTGELSCRPNGDCADARVSMYRCTNSDPARWNPGEGPENNPRRIWP